jgi:hypothetical protein
MLQGPQVGRKAIDDALTEAPVLEKQGASAPSGETRPKTPQAKLKAKQGNKTDAPPHAAGG